MHVCIAYPDIFRALGFINIYLTFQEMKVITPPGDYVGRVQQQCTWMVPVYHVRDANDQVLYVIEGPAVLQRSALMLSEFKVSWNKLAFLNFLD